jgi:glycosyltransferase involved in cell wall biosynthesis
MSSSIPRPIRSIGCIVPARNEEGNLESVIQSIQSLSVVSKVVIVEGGSTDQTFQKAQKLALQNPTLIKVIRQQGTGKFDAVLEGVQFLNTDKIVIWDADNTVKLDDTKRILEIAASDEYAIVGDRLRGTRERHSMRAANWLGNWAFAFLWLPVNSGSANDMLCGTKVFPREVFTTIPDWMIRRDPFGDFALVANCYRLNHNILFYPVHYRARVYGQTNIRRWKSGFILLTFTLLYYARRVFREI